MMGDGVTLSTTNIRKKKLFSSAGCEWTAAEPLHRLSDELPFSPQLFIRDVSEESGGAHGDQEQHEETQLHD